MTERIQLRTSDGETLEARWDSPESPRSAMVFCHPHPLSGGSMLAPLMISVTTHLVDHGIAVLRFNFRGTGASTGTHDYGVAELHDVDAAVSEAGSLLLPVALSGWSFGAATALTWLAERSSSHPYVGIAPPPERLPDQLPPGPKTIIVGTRDQIVDVDLLSRYASDHSIDLVLTPGDHFFHGRGGKIGDLVAQALN